MISPLFQISKSNNYIDGRDSDDETYDPANPDLEEYF